MIISRHTCKNFIRCWRLSLKFSIEILTLTLNGVYDPEALVTSANSNFSIGQFWEVFLSNLSHFCGFHLDYKIFYSFQNWRNYTKASTKQFGEYVGETPGIIEIILFVVVAGQMMALRFCFEFGMPLSILHFNTYRFTESNPSSWIRTLTSTVSHSPTKSFEDRWF